MMKNGLIIFLLFFVVSTSRISANSITQQTAVKVATNFMKSIVDNRLTIRSVVKEEYNGENSLYVVNFEQGGWAIVASDDFVVPILSYSSFGEYKLYDEKPEAFIELIDIYKESVAYSKYLGKSDPKITSMWELLRNRNKHNTSPSQYIPGDYLLNVPERGHINWGQDDNNDGGCIPSYNSYCPTSDNSECECERKPAGCGAVVMGQIMWYWQWPNESSYRTYDWKLMPPELKNGTTVAAGEEVARLLKDCGDASDMTYWCVGSWTTTNKVKEAFEDKFGYQSIGKHIKEHWEYGDAWQDLIRSEIDNGRPVFYRGDKSDLSSSKHFFIVDGYNANNPDYFHCNFGWGSSSYNTSSHYLNDITPGSAEFNANQRILVGISPTYPEFLPDNLNISDVSYTLVNDKQNEEAQENIDLPSLGKELIVDNDGELILTAGNSITLNSGFHIKSGSKSTVKIELNYTDEMDINVPVWVNAFSPNGDGVNDEFCIHVENADSFELQVFDKWGKRIFQSAGTINDDIACLWDGTGALCIESYLCSITFKNSYGRSIHNSYHVIPVCGLKSVAKTANYTSFQSSESTVIGHHNEILLEVYPNPNAGFLSLNSYNEILKDIRLYNFQGELCYQKIDINNTFCRIDISSLDNGFYVAVVELENGVVTKKIILEQ